MSRVPRDQRRSAILDAAVQVIIDVGYTEMTVADVAKRAGVSTALVHYHYSSKVELIVAAVRAACDEDKQLRRANAGGDAPTAARVDRVLCGSLPTDRPDGSWLLWIETWGETRRLAALREAMDDLNTHELDVLAGLFEAGRADREFECDDPRGTAARLAALRDGLAIQQTLFGNGRPRASFVGELRRGICHELGIDEQHYAGVVDPVQ